MPWTPAHRYTDDFADLCEGRGCLVAELTDVACVDPDVRLPIIKAGRDFVPRINEAMDHFVDFAEWGGASVRVIEYAEGRHGFDTELRTDRSAEIISQMIEFMKANFGFSKKSPRREWEGGAG